MSRQSRWHGSAPTCLIWRPWAVSANIAVDVHTSRVPEAQPWLCNFVAQLEAYWHAKHMKLRNQPVVAIGAASGAALIIAKLQLRKHELILACHRHRHVADVVVIRVLVATGRPAV